MKRRQHIGAPTDDDRVALILLRTGADLHARNMDTMLSQQAIKQHMPTDLAWPHTRGA